MYLHSIGCKLIVERVVLCMKIRKIEYEVYVCVKFFDVYEDRFFYKIFVILYRIIFGEIR